MEIPGVIVWLMGLINLFTKSTRPSKYPNIGSALGAFVVFGR